MPVIQFRGKVFPLIIVIDTARFDLLWPEPDGSTPMRFVLQVTNNHVVVDCTLQAYDPLMPLSMEHTRALELVRSVVDCIAFSKGVGLTVVFDEVVSPAGVKKYLVARNTSLEALATAFNVPESEQLDVYKIVIEDASLFTSLNELIAAITFPGLIAINCGRALDGLRQILVPNDPERTQGWIKLQEVLNLERSYREFVMKTSIPPRHADRTGIPQTIGQEVLERTWTIMNRFIEYRKRGSQQLPISEFPMLL